tara:strand:- start:1170 stop:1469 length:300 start_codon:yes stop_codon:yes gene_type:complete
MQKFKFGDVELTFNFKKLPTHDQDYLRSIVFETVNNKSVKSSGYNFHEYYPNANNFTLFKQQSTMLNYMTEFVGEYSYTTSHLLEGKKYWFAWTHNKRQ